jgi:hypothetical protein
MAGVLLDNGQQTILDVFFKNTAVYSNLYLGLMNETANPALSAQVGTGITEVTGTGYARIAVARNTDWTRVGQIVTAAQKTFTVGAGGWTAVNGYFIALSGVATTADAIWAEAFPLAQQGDKLEGDTVKITAKYEQKDDSE